MGWVDNACFNVYANNICRVNCDEVGRLTDFSSLNCLIASDKYTMRLARGQMATGHTRCAPSDQPRDSTQKNDGED